MSPSPGPEPEPAELARARARLADRQAEVLGALLSGAVPEGFDPAGAALTTRVLHARRRTALERLVPEVVLLPGWPAGFHTWAAAHPRDGVRLACAHDDADAYLGTLAGDPRVAGWFGHHAVVAGRRRAAWGRLGDRWLVTVGLGGRTWRWILRHPLV